MDVTNVIKFVTVITPACPSCKHTDKLIVNEQSYLAWRAGAFVQDAFPTMPVDRAEQLVSGFHPACWAEAFGSDL